MFPTSLATINEKLLLEVCTENWAESSRLEFKRELPTRDDEGKSEFLKDISALANAEGGDVLYGVMEVKGCASALNPITGDSPDSVKRRLGQLLDSGVEPRLAGIQFFDVAVAGGFVLVVRVPRSFSGPHWYHTVHGKRFAIRRGSHTSDMSYSQVRTAFTRTTSLLESAKSFREHRVATIQSGRTWAPLKSGPACIVHVIPIESTTGLTVDVLKIYHSYDAFYFHDWGGASRTLNLDGVVVHTGRVDGQQVPAYTQVFRNGAIEAFRFAGRTVDERKVIPGLTVATYVRSALEKFLPAIRGWEMTGPVIFGISLLDTSGYEFGGGTRYEGASPPADRPDLVLPEIWVEDLDQVSDIDSLAQKMLDVLWQCFDRQRCPYFDAAGKFSRTF